ncbi:hypothetical protein NKW48_12765, partial [Acetobacter oryzoeni]|nr:hypothetical protein [Acetobacter oryzoeni]
MADTSWVVETNSPSQCKNSESIMQNISEHSEKLESDAAQRTEGKERYVLRAGGAVGAGALIAVLLLHG